MPAPPMPDRTETLAPRAGGASTLPAESGRHTAAEPEAEIGELAADDPERYEPVGEHARGGLGRVVRAVDRRLGRTVAVKELLHRDPSNEARFLREAMITARLEHPGIVPVHEAGRWPNGDPYYVMKLVEGRTLKELIALARALRERLALLPHVIAVADAVGYAHSEGVIHRDLKPSNVIVGAFGQTIVVDWGLARDRKCDVPEPGEEILAVESAVSTVSGKVVGTPGYMSPEQARGDMVDERADVYALGAVLYEVLAGTPPHADATPRAVLDRVIAGPPRPLPLVAPGVPDELAAIADKAMARGPDARYPNAAALAEDLRRFTTGQLVSAHSYSAWALLRKKLARHRGVVAVAVASLIVLAAIGIASVHRVVAERNIARSQRGLAEVALSSAEKRKRQLVLLQAETALAKDPTAALAWLKTYEVDPEDRGKVVDMVDEALALGVARHVFRPGDWVLDARFTPDGRTLVVAARDGVIHAYDLVTGVETPIGQAPSPPEVLVLSQGGELAITGGGAGEVIAWPMRGGARRSLVDAGGRAISRLTLSPDGQRVLVERWGGMPEVVPVGGGAPAVLGPRTGIRFAVAADDWSRVVATTAANEVAVGGGVRALARTDKAIAFLAISPRGDTVVVHDGTTIWALPFTGGPLRELVRYPGEVKAIAWSPGGRTLALGGQLPEIFVVDMTTGAATELRGHGDAIYTLEFTRGGTRLLSASDDATARVWSLADRTAVVLRGHDDDVYRAWFSPDERSVVTASLDGSARVWELDPPGATVYVAGEPIEGMRADGDRVILRTRTAVERWDLATGRRARLLAWADEAHHLGYGFPSDGGEYVAIPSADGSIALRGQDGASIALRGHRGMITRIEFAPGGKTVYSSSSDGTLRRWDVATGAGAVMLAGTASVRSFALARDGRIAALAGDAAYLIDASGRVTRMGKGGAWCIAYPEFEPVTDRLVAHRCDGSLAIVDGARVIELSTGGYAARPVAVSPDGGRIAAGLGDRTIRVWDAQSGRVIEILRGHSDLVLDVAFSLDGRRLASASYDKTVRLWDLATGTHRVLRGHTAQVTRVVWRGAGHLVTGSPDGTLRLWDVPSLELPSASDIARRLDAATTARIASDRPETRAAAARRT